MKYVGNGRWMVGVPARDLTDEEVKKFGKKLLLDSGLYQDEEVKATRSTKHGRNNVIK